MYLRKKCFVYIRLHTCTNSLKYATINSLLQMIDWNITCTYHINNYFHNFKPFHYNMAIITTEWANKNRTLCYQLLIKIQANTQC